MKRDFLNPLKLFFALFAVACITSAFSHADKGVGAGGGGHVIYLPDGSQVQSADPWDIKLDDPFGNESRTVKISGVEYHFTNQQIDDLKLAIRLLKLHGADLVDQFAEGQILNHDVHFLVDTTLPEHPFCHQSVQLEDIPAGTRVVQGFCTIGNMTFMADEQFQDLSKTNLSANELLQLRITFTMEMIHERLRAWRPGISREVIAAITTGVQTMLDLNYRQHNYTGAIDFTVSESELRSLRNMLTGISMAQLSSNPNVNKDGAISELGGAFYWKKEGANVNQSVDETITVSPMLQNPPEFDVVNSTLNFEVPLVLEGKKASILNSHIQFGDSRSAGQGQSIIGDQVKVSDSEIKNWWNVSNSTILSSSVRGQFAAQGSTTDHAIFDSSVALSNTTVTSAEFEKSSVNFDSATISDSKFVETEFYAANSKVSNANFSVEYAVPNEQHSNPNSMLVTLTDGEFQNVTFINRLVRIKKGKTDLGSSIQFKGVHLKNVAPTTLDFNGPVHVTIAGNPGEELDFDHKPLDSVCEPGKHLFFNGGNPKGKCTLLMITSAVLLPTVLPSALIWGQELGGGSKKGAVCDNDMYINFKDLKNYCR